MGKSKNMTKRRRKVTRKGRPVIKPRGFVRSNRDVPKFDARWKIHNHAKEIAHVRIATGHTTVFDTGAQKSMIGIYGWEIIKRHDTWIDAQGVNIGGSSKSGHRLQLLDARGVMKNRLDGKRYMVILRQALFNPN